MKYSDIRKAIKSLCSIKTSTGEDVYELTSAAEALVNINILKGELEKAEKAIKSAIPLDKLPIKTMNGELITVATTQYTVDVKAVYKSGVIAEKDFWQAVKISESNFDKKDEKGKLALAEILKNKSVTGESTTIRVLKNEKLQDFEIQVAEGDVE